MPAAVSSRTAAAIKCFVIYRPADIIDVVTICRIDAAGVGLQAPRLARPQLDANLLHPIAVEPVSYRIYGYSSFFETHFLAIVSLLEFRQAKGRL